MNLRPTTNLSLNTIVKILGESTSYEKIVGFELMAVGVVEKRDDSKVLGIYPIEKLKGLWIITIKLDRLVVIAWLMVISALKVELEPGSLNDRSFKTLTAIKLVLGTLLMTAA